MMSESDLLNEFENTTLWTVLKRNYEFIPGFMQFGEGDILAEDENGDSLMAIECKYINKIATGKTAKVKRTKHRKKVVEQALLHASYVKIRNSNRRVQALTLTNENGLTVVDSDVRLSDAKRCVLEFINSVWYGLIPICAIPELKCLFNNSK